MIDIKVKFDASELKALTSLLGDEGAEGTKLLIGERTYDRWVQLAETELTTSRGAYIAGLQPPKIEKRSIVIRLEGSFPNLIEQGTNGFDMRDLLLAGGEPYRVIPFRHLGPNAKGTASGGGTPLGRAYSNAFAKDGARQLGRKVYNMAKKLGEGERLPAAAGGAFRLKETHAADLYEGMQRFAMSNSNQYKTFRTISRFANPMSWQYPATQGRNLAAKVLEEMPGIVEGVVMDMIAGIGGSR